jgi:hypothetical protein
LFVFYPPFQKKEYLYTGLFSLEEMNGLCERFYTIATTGRMTEPREFRELVKSGWNATCTPPYTFFLPQAKPGSKTYVEFHGYVKFRHFWRQAMKRKNIPDDYDM